jgi:amidophosphoribosyltransferase
MSGIFGVVSLGDCVEDIYLGTDYHSHMGSARAGMVVLHEGEFQRDIHSLGNETFQGKFSDVLVKFHGNRGVGVINLWP